MKMFFLLMASMMVFGCAQNQATPPNTDANKAQNASTQPTPGGAVREIVVEGCKESVSLVAGQLLVLKLPATAGTGFAWAVTSKPDQLVSESGDDLLFEPREKVEENVVGFGSWQVLTFKATAAGEGSLELNYFRPFEPKNIEQTCKIKVTVTN